MHTRYKNAYHNEFLFFFFFIPMLVHWSTLFTHWIWYDSACEHILNDICFSNIFI